MKSDFEASAPILSLESNRHIAPDKILSAAMNALTDVVLVGVDRDGHLYLASSKGAEHATELLQRGLKDLKARKK